jgi:hypothetical protein
MFDRFKDALMAGQFRMAIESEKLPDGQYKASWVAPNGTKVEHTDSSQAEAHRQVTDKVRNGVMDGSLELGR